MSNPLWLDLGRVSLQFFSEHPWKLWSIGVRISLEEPALDVFLLWWMVSLTTVAHREWIASQGVEMRVVRLSQLVDIVRSVLQFMWDVSGFKE